MEILKFHGLFLLLAAPCVGSFLGVVALRLPKKRPLLWDRSVCPDCGHRLGPWELIPLLGWLIGRGACRHCRRPISKFYPAIELAALGVAVWSLAILPAWLAWATAALGWCLVALSVVDARHLLLPDELTLPLVPAGLAVAWAVEPAKLPDHALGALAGFLIVWILGLAYRKIRHREGIGLGDAKLLAAAGAWVSWQGLPGVLLLAAAGALIYSLAQAVVSRRWAPDRELPFGPYLAAALWLVWLYGPPSLG